MTPSKRPFGRGCGRLGPGSPFFLGPSAWPCRPVGSLFFQEALLCCVSLGWCLGLVIRNSSHWGKILEEQPGDCDCGYSRLQDSAWPSVLHSGPGFGWKRIVARTPGGLSVWSRSLLLSFLISKMWLNHTDSHLFFLGYYYEARMNSCRKAPSYARHSLWGKVLVSERWCFRRAAKLSSF